MKKRELYWFLGTLGLVLIFILILFGLDGFRLDSTFDINIYDTYLVMSNFHFTALIFVFVFFGVYLFRAIRNGFKNFTVNIIAMVTTILMLWVLDVFTTVLDILGLPYDTTENRPLSRERHPVEQFMSVLSKVIRGLQIMLLVFLAYSCFSAGRNYRPKN